MHSYKTENWMCMKKTSLTENPHPLPRFYFCGNGDRNGNDFGCKDGNKKTFPDPTVPCYHP